MTAISPAMEYQKSEHIQLSRLTVQRHDQSSLGETTNGNAQLPLV